MVDVAAGMHIKRRLPARGEVGRVRCTGANKSRAMTRSFYSVCGFLGAPGSSYLSSPPGRSRPTLVVALYAARLERRERGD